MLDEAWVLGFLSGVGYTGKAEYHYDPLHGLDRNAVAAWIDIYCWTYPLQDIVDAAAGFVHVHSE
jgi:hypothetical protein